MTAFGKALAAMFADPNMAVTALYRRAGVGAGDTVRAARYSPSGTSTFAQEQIIAEGEQIEVAKTDAPFLADGDTFEIGADLWAVKGDPERGGLDMTWIATLKKVI